MKKIFFVIAAAAMMLVGCTKELTQRLDKVECDLEDLTTRVEKLEQAVKDLNAETASIQTLLNGTTKLVADVTETADGYKISFTDGTSATITGAKGEKGDKGDKGDQGEKGEQGEQGAAGADAVIPQIGIAAGEDGVLYWTLDGKFITLEDGSYVPARGEKGEQGEQGAPGADGAPGAPGADGAVVTPSFAIDENGHLIMTIGDTKTDLGDVTGEDGAQGATGETGATGDSWFSGVEVNDDNVVITLNDEAGTEIVLPRYSEFGLTVFPKPIALGGTSELGYAVTGTEDFVVRAYASEDWKAVVDAKKSLVNVTASEDQELYRAGWVDVYAIDNVTGKVAARSVVFSNDGTKLEVSENVVVPAAGIAALDVAVSTDYVYDVKVAEDATWLKYVKTKAVRNETLEFSAEANKTGANRTATVELTVDGVVKATITFEQRALATAMTVEPKEVEYVIGQESVKFTATVTPADADQAVTYTVLDENGDPTSSFIFVGSEFQITDAEGVENYLNTLPGEYTVVVTSVSNPEVKVEVPVTVKAILIEEIKPAAELVKLKVGQVVAIDYAVLPENSSDNTVVFTIDPDSDPNVITVDAEGNVKAIAPGEAKVVITANDLYANNADPETYVAPYAEVVFAISNELAVTDLVFAESEIDLHVADKTGVALELVATPEAATNKSVEYTVLKDGKPTTELVVVDGKLKVNPEATNYLNVIAGKTYTVVATAVENPTVEAELTVNVYANYVESVELDAVEKTINVGENVTLTATVNPEDADDKTLKWYSSNDAVATVDHTGKVTAVAVGNAVITCESMDSFNLDKEAPIKAECKVFVKTEDMEYAVTEITFPETELEIAIDDESGVALNAQLNPADAPLSACTWTVKDQNGTSNQLIVKDGKVFINPAVFETMQDYTMVGKTYTVTATSTYDADVTASVEVTVTAVLVEELTLGAEELVMYVGEEYAMKYTIAPEEATDPSVKWLVNGDAVTVDENGLIKAVAAGEATVTLEALDKYNLSVNAEDHLSSSCVIKVIKKAPTAISFAEESYTVKLGQTLQLEPVFDPTDAAMYDLAVKYEVVAGAIKEKISVDENGLVTAKEFNTSGTMNWETFEMDFVPNNTYTIRASYVNYPELYADVKVVVDQYLATACSVNFEEMTMVVGDVFRPTVDAIPADATNKDTYTFSSTPLAGGYTTGINDNGDGSFTAKTVGEWTVKVSMGNPTGTAYGAEPPYTTFKLTVVATPEELPAQ